jgi:hypothetical protein
MTRKPKALGIALVAVFAMSAVVASAASAKEIHSGASPTYIHGLQTSFNIFELTNEAPTECVSTTYEAGYPGTTASSLFMTPTYANCKSFGQKSTIDMNGCDYLFATPVIGADSDHYTSSVKILCPTAGGVKQKIEITATGCTVTIEEQTPTSPLIDITNVTTATANQDDLLLKSTLTGIKYTSTGGPCGASGEGKFTGEVTLKAYSNAHTTQVDLWVA